MTKYLGFLMAVLIVALAFAVPEQEGEKDGSRVTLLSRHETVAMFQGTNYHKCMGRTALCPDKCGDSGIRAIFKIVEYISYDNPNGDGDDKQDEFIFMVEDNMGNLKVSEAVSDMVKSLEKFDGVLLSWDHNYIESDQGSYPVRPITKLEKVGKAE